MLTHILVHYAPLYKWPTRNIYTYVMKINMEFMRIDIYSHTYMYIIHIYINGLHLHTGSSVCLHDDEDESARPHERAGVINISVLRVYSYILTYIHLHYTHTYKMHIQALAGSSMFLDDEEDGSARPRECAGVAQINQHFVCVNIYSHTYIHSIYMY